MEASFLFFVPLLTCTCISAIREGLFKSKDSIMVAGVYKNILLTEPSKIFCTQLCVADYQCVAANYNNETLSCELSSYHPADIACNATKADGWIIMYKTDAFKDDWIAVFRGTSGIDIDVAESFLGTNAESLPIPEPGCYARESMDCKTHVRSPLIDDWRKLSIKKVNVKMLKDGKSVAYMIFQNRPTDDKVSWFCPENLLNSSWTDLPSETHVYEHFQMERLTIGRSFHVFQYWGGCSADVGWMFVSEVVGFKACFYEQHNEYPQFVYTTGSTKQNWSSGFDMAEIMMISIK